MSLSLSSPIIAPSCLLPGQKFKIGCDVQNIGSTNLGNMQAIIKDSPYWSASTIPVSPLKINESTTIGLEVKVKNEKTIKKLPKHVQLEIKHGEKVVGGLNIELSMEFFTSGIKDFKPVNNKPKLNILLFGGAGTGKTTLIKTILSTMKGDIVRTIGGFVGGGSEHASTTFREIRVSKTISVWDAWGATTNNYKADELSLMLIGAVPPNWNMGNPIDYTDDIIRSRLTKTNPDAISAVFFTITQELVNDPVYKANLKKWIDVVKQKRNDLQPMLILTKIDEINPNLRTEPSLNDSILAEKLTQISAETDVPENYIFPTLGYTKENECTFDIDKLICIILQRAISSASEVVIV